jgi:hypothetical protein
LVEHFTRNEGVSGSNPLAGFPSTLAAPERPRRQRSSSNLERLDKILTEIVDILDPNAQPDQALRNVVDPPTRSPFSERMYTTEACCVDHQLARLKETVCAIRILQVEAKNRAKTRHLAPC